MESLKLEELEIRESSQEDWGDIEALYQEAFPEENLPPLVQSLLHQVEALALSLVGTIHAQMVGHVIFTKCEVIGQSVNAALLAPLAVAPAWQRQGIGSAMVREGLRRLKEAEVSQVFVLGDPEFYVRLGFVSESLVEPPYPLPVEWKGAWQSQGLEEATAPCSGKLSVPPQWLQRSLWTP